MKKSMIALTTLFLVFILTGPVFADTNDGIPDAYENPGVAAPYYGTASTSILRIPFANFIPRNSACTYQYSNMGYVNKTAGTACFFWAPVNLPSGALLQQIILSYYDNNAANLWLFLTRFYDDGVGDPAYQDMFSTGSTGTPGYDKLTLNPNVTIDNSTNNYVVYVYYPDAVNDNTITARDVQLVYSLQVSAAPGTATFSDVPTSHMFFQYIEALAAAGITTGYPDGTYGPDNYVTRGQMAVFLSRGFGLHWPN